MCVCVCVFLITVVCMLTEVSMNSDKFSSIHYIVHSFIAIFYFLLETGYLRIHVYCTCICFSEMFDKPILLAFSKKNPIQNR